MKRVMVTALVALSACGRHEAAPVEPPAPPAGEVWLTSEQVDRGRIRTEAAADHTVRDTLLAAGRVVFDEERTTHVFSPVSGRVARVLVQTGDRVKRGAPLAVVESPDVGAASADLAKAMAELTSADHERQRQKDLAASHATSEREQERAEDDYRKARAEVDRARQKASLLRAGHVDRVSQSYTLTAEMDGEVIARNIAPGAEVQGQYGGGTAMELFTLGDTSRVWVLAAIHEVDLGRVQAGSRASVSVVAYPQTSFEGAVDWVPSSLDPATRAAEVRIKLDNADRRLRPGMFATVRLTEEERRTLAVPRASLVRLGEQTVVYERRGEAPGGLARFVRVPLSVDEGAEGSWTPVSQGVQPGAQVVVEGAMLVAGSER